MVDDQALQVGLARDPEGLLEMHERAGMGLGRARRRRSSPRARRSTRASPARTSASSRTHSCPRGLSARARAAVEMRLWCLREDAADAHRSSPMKPPLMRNAISAEACSRKRDARPARARRAARERPVEGVRGGEARRHAGRPDERVEHVVVARAEDDDEHERRVEQRQPREHGARSQPERGRRDHDRASEVQADRRRGLVAQGARVRGRAVGERQARDPVRRRERVEREHRERRHVQEREGRAQLGIAHGIEQPRRRHERRSRRSR